MDLAMEGDVRSLGASELLVGQGQSMVVFHPGEQQRPWLRCALL